MFIHLNSRYITPEKFFVEAINSNELLVIDRVSQEITLQGMESSCCAIEVKSKC